jgi:Ala-tRNA(Pro) deacylase
VDLARLLHESGHHVVKPVVFQADDELVICAVPSCRKVDPERVREAVGASMVKLADERTMGAAFSGCEIGAEPPIGEMFRIRTIMDESLCDQPELMFLAGSHRETLTMPLVQYLKLAHPQIASVTYEQ